LRTVLANGRLPVPRAIAIARQVLAGLAHAHEHAIVHRDVKPENIVLVEGAGLVDHVRILDFGLAKLRDSSTVLTVGLALGTPNYMAPEQMREGPVDERVDVYAAGLLLFEMLTGKKPFDAPDIGQILLRQQKMPAPSLHEMVPDQTFAPELEAVVRRALEKAPEARFLTAQAMAEALEAVPGAAPAATRPKGPPPGMPGRKHADATIVEAAPWGKRPDEGSTQDPSNAATVLYRGAVNGPKGGPGAAAQRLSRHLGHWGGRLRTTAGAGYRWMRLSRRRMAMVLCGAAAVAFALVILGRGSSEPRKPGASDVRPVAAPTQQPSVPGKPQLSEVEKVAARGDRDQAIAMLTDLRKRFPRDPEYAVVLARLYFEKRWWTQGVAAFHAAIRLDPQRRGDPVLIGHVVASLQSERFAGDAEDFLRELGSVARDQVSEAARSHPSPRVRARARELLDRWDRQPSSRSR
jgi:serine/threonine-protein kinase